METRGKNNPLPPGMIPKGREPRKSTPPARPEPSTSSIPNPPRPEPAREPTEQEIFQSKPRPQNKAQQEIPQISAEVTNRIMQTEVPCKLSQLIAISPAVRENIHRLTQQRRALPRDVSNPEIVEVNSVLGLNTFIGNNSKVPGNPPDGFKVGKDSVPLAETDVLVNGDITVSALIDDGCQVIVVHQDLWRELQIAKHPQEALRLESVDQNVSITQGRIRNLPVTMGGITFYLQAQVVSKAPAGLILGKPFMALANAWTETFEDGFTTLCLRDPNSPEHRIMVACRLRDGKKTRETNYYGLIQDLSEEEDEGIEESLSAKSSQPNFQ
jgi:hypothetical protein